MDNQHYNDFRNSVERLGFTDLPIKGYYQLLMDNNLETFLCSQRMEFGKDQVKYNLEFRKGAHDKLPYFFGYTATMKQVPVIQHGSFAGIDTAALEEKLKALNWDAVISTYRQNPENNGFMPAFQDVYGQLAQLQESRNPDAMSIAHGLMANYWLDTAMEKYIDLSYVRDVYERKHAFTINNEQNDVTAKEAYHLLSGRAILKFDQISEHQFNGYWKQIDGWGFERSYPGFDISKVLRDLSVQEMKTDKEGIPLLVSLLSGELTPAIVTGGNKPVEVMLQADPKNQTILLLGKDGRPIAPELLQAADQKEERKEQPSIKPPVIKRKPGKNKGRSL